MTGASDLRKLPQTTAGKFAGSVETLDLLPRGYRDVTWIVAVVELPASLKGPWER